MNMPDVTRKPDWADPTDWPNVNEYCSLCGGRAEWGDDGVLHHAIRTYDLRPLVPGTHSGHNATLGPVTQADRDLAEHYDLHTDPLSGAECAPNCPRYVPDPTLSAPLLSVGPDVFAAPADPAGPLAADRPVAADWYTDPRLSYAQGLTDGFNNGVAAGIRLANEAVDRAITAALRRPAGHGGPDLDQEVRETMREVYGRYLGIGRLTS